MVGGNFRDFFYDWSLILCFFVFLVTSLLTFWRIKSHKHWYTNALTKSVQENLKLKQQLILDILIARIKMNV
jgi:hypothetical protein